jgi:hypothetical protein
MALCRVIVMWLVWVIVLFLIEFNSILEIYNNPTPQTVGFFIEYFKNYNKIMLRSNSTQIIIPTTMRTAMLPSGKGTDNSSCKATNGYRFVVSSSQENETDVPDYHRFKACFDFKNQENIRVWQIPK